VSGPMSECAHNVQGKAASARGFKDCINVMQSELIVNLSFL